MSYLIYSSSKHNPPSTNPSSAQKRGINFLIRFTCRERDSYPFEVQNTNSEASRNSDWRFIREEYGKLLKD